MIRTIFRGPLATIVAWTCRAYDTRPGSEEAADGNDVVFTRRGSFLRSMRGETIVAEPATALFFPRLEPYRVSHPVSGGDSCVVLSFTDEVLAGFETSMKAGGVTVAPRQALRLHGLLGGIDRGRSEARDPLRIEETALDLAGSLLRAAVRDPAGHSGWRRRGNEASRRHRRSLERVKLLLASRYDERLTLSAIAREAACSPFHLCRLFWQETGFTLHRYLNRLRLLRSLEMLEPGTDLATVALKVGFSSHSHFSATFRREFGVPPSRVTGRVARRFGDRFRKNLTARPQRPA